MRYVILRNAVGREQVVAVYARNDNLASNAALRQVGGDWMVVRVLDYHPDALIG